MYSSAVTSHTLNFSNVQFGPKLTINTNNFSNYRVLFQIEVLKIITAYVNRNLFSEILRIGSIHYEWTLKESFKRFNTTKCLLCFRSAIPKLLIAAVHCRR